MMPEGCLHGALRLADHARADVVRIDTGPALELDGVEAVYTAADVPGELRVGIIYKDWPIFIPEGGRTSYLGDVLAIVVAETREIARHAATLIECRIQRSAADRRPRARHRRQRGCGLGTRRQCLVHFGLRQGRR